VTDPETTFDSLLDQLGRCPNIPEGILEYCAFRYEKGIEEFVDEEGNPLYLSRDNCIEGMEEAADGVNYAIMESLKRAAEGKEDKRELALDAAYHFAMAYSVLTRLRAVADG
jgi:hypothetical protein